LRLHAVSTPAQWLAEEDLRRRTTTAVQLPAAYVDFYDVFDKHEFDTLPPCRIWDHAIELIEGAEPRLDCKIYPLGRIEQEKLDEFLLENSRTNRIRPSRSPMASPFFFIKKKDGSLRPVQDYRRLNAITVPDRYPIPLIPELIDSLRQAKIFSKLDVRWGYNNIRIKDGDEFKVAFRTNRGLFEPQVMFFGLTNSPTTFQRMMNEILKELVAAGNVLVYLDDILIFTEELDHHRQVLHAVLQELRRHRLSLKLEKCQFETQETEYLGVVVGNGRVRMDSVKVQGVVDWPTPTTCREVQSFLGFCNFYRRFVCRFTGIAQPLTELTGLAPFEWTKCHQDSFDVIQTALTTAPILALLTNEDPYRLEADASAYAVGATLSQRQDGVWRPVAFMSKALSPT
jgi:hypothetical protein